MKRIWIPQLIACGMLLLALNPGNPYGYYILLRWVCCAVFAYLAYYTLKQEKRGWTWVLGITAVVYNPILRVHLTRDIWSVINLITIGIAVASVFIVKKEKDKPKTKPNKTDARDPSKANNTSDAITSQELGDYLFGLCLRQVASFLDIWEHSFQEKTNLSKDDIDQVELLIAFMWSYFDLLQNKEYLDAFTMMHGRFRRHMNDLNIDADEMWRVLQARYDEYRQKHRSQGAIDFTYKKVASEICKNILNLDIPNTNLMLELQITITLQQNVLNIGKAIKSMPIKDV